MGNPITLRRAHIKEELAGRRLRAVSVDGRLAAHDHRDEIICLGYNEMFPAVLALGDAVDKQVVVVEYDPVKIATVNRHYSEEQRNEEAAQKKRGGKVDTAELKSQSSEKEDTKMVTTSSSALPLRGVVCEYADIHDPESWEELEIDQAFMVVCTMTGAHHAEKAIAKWLRKHDSDTIYIGCTSNNAEALQLYDAGAHFVMQTDALAMRSTKEIFIETVANIGNCSQLVAAGAAHARRLKNLKSNDKLRFLYETG